MKPLFNNAYVVRKSPEEYELFISPMVLEEIEKSPEPKLSKFLGFLKIIELTKIPKSNEGINLADIYLKEGVLSARRTQDLHLVTARKAHNERLSREKK